MSAATEIRQTQNHGNALVATRSMDPGVKGIEILREKAVAVFPPEGSPKYYANPARSFLRSSTAEIRGFVDYYWWYLQQTPGVKESIMGFYADLTCSSAANTGRVMSLHWKSIEQSLGESADMGELVKVVMVLKFNGFAMHPPSEDGTGSGEDFGSALFVKACRMSHSCFPNCVSFSSQNGTERIVRLIMPIKEGDELTVSYIENVCVPTYERRQTLSITKNFECECNRCTCTDGDDTRRFYCESSSCSGVHFVHQRNASDEPILLPCTVCGKEANENYTEDCFDREAKAKRQIDFINYTLDSQQPIDIRSLIGSVEPPHKFHYLAEKLSRLEEELAQFYGDHKTVAKWCKKQLESRFEIFGWEDIDDKHALILESLGDAEEATLDLAKAEETYRIAVRSIQLHRGGIEHPYSNCIIRKILSVQQRLGDKSKTRAKKCSLCGIAATFRCSRCQQVWYCSKEHQKLSWSKVHKTLCKKMTG